MVRVVVDTNIVGGVTQQPLSGREMLLLIDETGRGNLSLVVPEIVLREASNLWAERVVKQAGNYSRARAVLRQAGLIDEEAAVRITKEGARATEEKRIRRLLEDADATIAPLPQIGQEEVIERALDRRQPFDTNGRNGYRDVMVWETVMEIGREGGTVIFIANDKGAFFENREFKGGLAKDLASEFAEACKGEANLAIFHEADAGYKAAREQADTEEKERLAAQEIISQAWLVTLNEKRRADPGFALLLSDAVDEAVRNWDLGQDLREFGIQDSDVYGAYVDVVESVHKIEFVSAHLVKDGDVLTELSAEVVCWAEATMSAAMAMVLDREPQVQIRKVDFDTDLAEGQVEIAARVTVDLVVEPHAGRLTSLATVSGFEPIGPPEFFLGMETPPGIGKTIEAPDPSN